VYRFSTCETPTRWPDEPCGQFPVDTAVRKPFVMISGRIAAPSENSFLPSAMVYRSVCGKRRWVALTRCNSSLILFVKR
jgi:hypothetical protein